ncbi:Mov34/MPN/PAD-1 family protein [Algibacter sp. R77976]|uniref:Mov34/MPN/PAD-1 family protein n=1 Tax=Algibacter sp. R77976 TaxID=3093873 RepID=UPI0037C7E9C2
MKITTSAYTEMLKTVGSRPAESGGLLFGSRKDWVVTKFLYDKNAKTTKSSYSFNVGYLNPMMDTLAEEGLQLLGFFHSHPQGYKQLSEPDKMYFEKQFNNIPVDKFLVPLMFPATDGTYDFVPYVFHKDGRVEKTTLELLPDDYTNYLPSGELSLPNQIASTITAKPFSFKDYYKLLWSIFYTGLLLFSLGVLFHGYKYISQLLNTLL